MVQGGRPLSDPRLNRSYGWNLALLAVLVLAMITALAGGAHAASPSPSLAALNAAVRPGLASAPPETVALPPPAAERGFSRITMLKTAIDRRLTADGLTGSLGLLCGRQPSRDISGGAGAFDQDREGKFVGAQLSRAF
jgi:hypothetical protein